MNAICSCFTAWSTWCTLWAVPSALVLILAALHFARHKKKPKWLLRKIEWLRTFYVWLGALAILGGTWAFFLPIALNSGFTKNDDGPVLRQLLIYATGGLLGAITLGETRRKNDQEHMRQVHAERRSRYTKAVEQLADEKAPIRLGGVYTLAKLVDDWLDDEKTLPSEKERRQEGQIIIDSLCAYIRSSFPLAERYDELTLSYEEYQQKYQDNQGKNQSTQSVENSADNSTPKPEEHQDNKQSREEFVRDKSIFREEQEVRQTILSEIEKRLNGGTTKNKDGRDEIKPGTWSYFEYDFSNAVFFYPTDFRSSLFGNSSNFFQATFTVGANFSNVKFTRSANFSGATFIEHANFPNVKFTEDADFSMAEFTGYAYFSIAEFTKKANFSKAKFTDADFSMAEFTGSADFFEAKFTDADFFEAKFTDADFSWAEFTGYAYFSMAEFTKNANFSTAKFTKKANFSWAKFTKKANFSWAEFTGYADFSWAEFTGYADFSKAEFTKKANFSKAKFTKASFSRAKFTKRANFSTAKFTKNANFSGATFEEKPQFEYALGNKTYKARFSCKADSKDYNFEVSPDSPYKIETEEKEYNETKFIIPKGTELFDPDEPSE